MNTPANPIVNPIAKPIVQPSPMTQAFWDAAAQGRLVLQTCTACGTIRHYPRLLCTHCFSLDYFWKDSPGLGAVHSWTHCHHAFHPGFASELPYTLVTVDLDEGVRSLGIWKGGDQLALGMRVQGRYDSSRGNLEWLFEPVSI